jgi:hypothetical protein
MLFQELTKLSMEKLAKQPLMTYEEKKAQLLKVKLQSTSMSKRKTQQPKQ